MLAGVISACGKSPLGHANSPPSDTAATSAAGEPSASVKAALLPSVNPRPVGATARVGYLEGADRLRPFFQALAALDDHRRDDDVRILQFGDSHTASDLGTAVFRRILQGRFGDGGRGFVSIGRPWKTYTQDGIVGAMSRDFEPERAHIEDGHPVGDGFYGLLGVAIAASRRGARASSAVAARSSRVEVGYFQTPGGGAFDFAVDGEIRARVLTGAAEPGAGFMSVDMPDAPHELEVRVVGDGVVRVFGMALDRAPAGVVVDALGINGAQIFTPLRVPEEPFAAQLRHRPPSLVVLAYGTNEALDPKLEIPQYEQALSDLIGRVARACPDTSCLLLGPPDLARWSSTGGWATFPRLLEIVAIQRRMAQAAGCAFYDQVGAMGGPGAMAAWAAESEPRAAHDRVHLTRRGYAQVAASFATDLMGAYDAFRAAAPSARGVAHDVRPSAAPPP